MEIANRRCWYTNSQLSLKIQRHYDAHKQTEAQLLNKNRARKSIEDLLKLHLHPGTCVTSSPACD